MSDFLDVPVGPGAAHLMTLRRSNLALVLRRLRDHGPRSRARLATELGVTRSAASSLVSELTERGLVRTGVVERGGVGRPGTAVELDGHTVCGIGAEINVNHVATMALDLAGRVVAEHRIPLDAHRLEVAEVIDRLVELVRRTTADLAARGASPVGLTVGVAGLVDSTRDVLTLAPQPRVARRAARRDAPRAAAAGVPGRSSTTRPTSPPRPRPCRATRCVRTSS